MIIDVQRIILINGSRLLGDMLQRVICRVEHLEMVQEVGQYEELPAAIENTEAEWALMSLPFGTDFPAWVDEHLAKHPSMRFVAIFTGSGRVLVKGLGSLDEELKDSSLHDLIQILEGHPQQLRGL